MKYVIFKKDGSTRLGGLLKGDADVVDLAAAYAEHLATRGVFAATKVAEAMLPPDLVYILQAAPISTEAVKSAMDIGEKKRGRLVLPLASVKLLAPLRPGKIIGVRRNYLLHAEEAKRQVVEEPRMFFKLPQSVIGPGDSIERTFTKKLDYEAEIVVVIGRKAKNVARANALEYVAGYALGNDVSARELQLDWKPEQTSLAKSFDTHAPLGPWVATTDEFATAPPVVTIKCWVNGDLRQNASTDTMIFDVALIVSYLSQFVTLEPGDAVYTGTPAGVGAFMNPPGYLKPGDVVKVAADGLGELVNPVVEAAA
ncbi:MAG: fumarylacetoacetate hydrolase family protein [Alphaproteobacteria bacterium]|nr:fumarylacetoacetate hydrolase family protein [Alphaproteobacteria bacterium]